MDDLLFAATWLEEYEEGADGHEEVERCRRVATVLRSMAERQQRREREREVVQRCATETGRSLAECRAALRRVQARARA